MFKAPALCIVLEGYVYVAMRSPSEQDKLTQTHWSQSSRFFRWSPSRCRLFCPHLPHESQNSERSRELLRQTDVQHHTRLWQILWDIKKSNLSVQIKPYILLQKWSTHFSNTWLKNGPVWLSSRFKVAPFEFSIMRSLPFHNGWPRSPQSLAL